MLARQLGVMWPGLRDGLLQLLPPPLHLQPTLSNLLGPLQPLPCM